MTGNRHDRHIARLRLGEFSYTRHPQIVKTAVEASMLESVTPCCPPTLGGTGWVNLSTFAPRKNIMRGSGTREATSPKRKRIEGSGVYDAQGRRVRKTTSAGSTDYFYDLNNRVTGELNAGAWVAEYVYLGSRLIAQYKNATTYFIHSDHLGSTRLVTGLANPSTPIDSLDYLPFGQQMTGDTATSHKFTGKERDSESGLDNFGARYFGASTGRFMSADPVAGSAWNPQSLIRLEQPTQANRPKRNDR